jgi:hypothetical protein
METIKGKRPRISTDSNVSIVEPIKRKISTKEEYQSALLSAKKIWNNKDKKSKEELTQIISLLEEYEASSKDINPQSKIFEIERIPILGPKIVDKIDISKFEKKPKTVFVSEPKKIEPVKKEWTKPKIEIKPKIKVESKPEQVYVQETIHFFLDPHKKIVGRLKNGKIAIIDFNYNDEWVKDNEDWIVNIKSELDKKAIIIPVKLVVTAEENQKQFDDSLKQLEGKDWNKAIKRSYSPLNYSKTTKRHKNI